MTGSVEVEWNLEARLGAEGNNDLLAGKALVTLSLPVEQAGHRDLGGEGPHQVQVWAHGCHRSVRVAVSVATLQSALGVHAAGLIQECPSAQEPAFVGGSAQAEDLTEGAVLQHAGEDGVSACSAGEVADDPAGGDAVGRTHHGVDFLEEYAHLVGVADDVLDM